MSGTDFQDIYREHAYEVYRSAFEELKDPERTRECVYEVFSRIRTEDLSDQDEVGKKIQDYLAEYIVHIKNVQKDVDQVWYRIRSDELGTQAAEEDMPSFRDRLMDEARRMEQDEEESEIPSSDIPDEPAGDACPEQDDISESESESENEYLAADEVYEETEDSDFDEFRGHRKGSKIYWLIFIVIMALLLWIVADILMYKDILPGFDLGYSWFNNKIFALFPYA